MYKLKIVLTCMATVCHPAISTSVSHKFVNRRDLKLIQDYVASDVSGLSKLQCAAICENNLEVVNCLSVSWHASSGLCLISNLEAFNMDHLESAVGWITLAKVKYPVFIMVNATRQEALSMSYAQGEAKCATYGASVANASDMLEARNMGMHECACGWLSDGTIGLVLQNPWPECIEAFTDQIILCDWEMPGAWVWCRFPW